MEENSKKQRLLEDENQEQEPLLKRPQRKEYSFSGSFAALQKNPREFWILYIFEAFCLIPFSMSVISMQIYNTRILHFTDKDSGLIIGLIGISVALSSIAFSSFPARYGLKAAFFISGLFGITYGSLMYLNFHPYIQVCLAFFILIPSVSISFISLKLGVKLYTFPESRSLGYSFFFMIFFAVAGMGAGAIDAIFSKYGIKFESFQVIFIMIICMNFLLIIGSLTIRNLDVELSGESHLEFNRATSGWEFTKEVLKTKTFWKFFSLITVLTVIKSMYFHLTATLPLYMLRSLGEQSHFGYLMGVHQLVLLIFIPLLTALIKFYDFYTLLAIGSFVTAVSPAVLFYADNYWTLGVFVVVMSIGEAIYAPRLVDYTIAAAPQGKEAIYLGLSNMPNSLGLLITGITSGYFLSEFCPQNGERQCFWVWILIGLYCFIAFLIIIIFRSFFDEKIHESHIPESELAYAESKNTLRIE